MNTNAIACETAGTQPDRFATIQIHPTLQCNLSCLHCYSSSAPHHRGALALDDLKPFLEKAYAEGFNTIAVSGGEPFLYRDLEGLLEFTHDLGYWNTMASNGMLLRSQRARRILELVDLIALSVDGPPTLHDHIRGQKGAFVKMLEGAHLLRDLDKPFGFIHTVTPQSWESLLWLGEFAHEQGASLLQLHPLEMYGRATEMLPASALDDTMHHRIFILANYLRSKYAGQMAVQLDLLHREYLREYPQSVNTFERQCASTGRVSDLFDTIIVEESGCISPVSYGFSQDYSIGQLSNFTDSTFAEFLETKVPDIRKLFDKSLRTITQNQELDVINWNEAIIRASHSSIRACA